jgi:hypothetical protein
LQKEVTVKTVRYFAAFLLVLTGLLHVMSPVLFKLETAALVVMVLFGAAYLIVGGCLCLERKTACYFGAIVPFVGLIFAALGMVTNPAMFSFTTAFLMVIDVVLVATCVYLIRRKGVVKTDRLELS